MGQSWAVQLLRRDPCTESFSDATVGQSSNLRPTWYMRFDVPSECLRDVNCDAHDSFYIESVSSIHIYSVLYS